MRRASILTLLALLLLPCAAGAASVAIGAYGGGSLPVLQDDTGGGTMFGLRAPVSLVPLVTIEPYFARCAGSDKSQDIEGTTITRSGIDVTGFGANVMLTFGGKLQFYPFLGVGTYSLSREGMEDASNLTYTFGMGLGVSPMPKLSVHARGELAAAVDGEVSRKWANVTLGVSYVVFSTPTP